MPVADRPEPQERLFSSGRARLSRSTNRRTVTGEFRFRAAPVVAQPEIGRPFVHRPGLACERLGGRGVFLHQRGITLRDFVHLRQRRVDLLKTGRLLAAHHYQVAYANDGLEAVQQLRAQRPDVVITDVEMPGMDGFALTRHVRAEAALADIPVIMITAADERHRDEASQAGVSVLLGKPYPEDELIAHIRRVLGQDEVVAGALA